MKKLLSILLFTALLTSLTSCSGDSKETNSEKRVDTTTVASESSEAAREEIPLNSKNLNSKLDFENFTMKISKDWELSSEEEKETIYDISQNSTLSIETSIDRTFKAKAKTDAPTNEDYIDYRLSDNSNLQIYQTDRSILFLYNKSEDGSYYEYQFFNNGKVYNLTFRAFSHHFFSQESIDNVLNTISLVENKSTSTQATDKSTEPTSTQTTNKPTEPPTTKPNIANGQENALKSAKSYIKIGGFSRDELVEQLEYEKYSHDEAVYGADNCGADWNAEALESAKSYIEMSGFSYSGLIEQLEYEKYTPEQARYGADNCGADWNQEAADSAKSYLRTFDFSREELIDQLLYEGFTQEQAEYGASANGY